MRLNAPYGAPCFLAISTTTPSANLLRCLNVPYGAPRFLTIASVIDGNLTVLSKS